MSLVGDETISCVFVLFFLPADALHGVLRAYSFCMVLIIAVVRPPDVMNDIERPSASFPDFLPVQR